MARMAVSKTVDLGSSPGVPALSLGGGTGRRNRLTFIIQYGLDL